MIKYLPWVIVIITLGLVIWNSVSGIRSPEPDFSAAKWVENYNSGNLYPWESSYTEYDSLAYPPLYYLLWFSIGDSLLPGQVISILCTVLIVGVIYLISRMYIKGSLARCIPGILFLLSPATMYWSTITRSDMMALLLVMCGVYVLLRFKELGLYLSAPLFVLALFTKQWYIAAPIAVCLVYWKKELFYFLTYYIGFLLIGTILAVIYTSGTFLTHVVLFPIQSGGTSVLDFGRLCLSSLITIGTNLGILCGLSIVIYRVIKERQKIFKDYLVVLFLVSLLLMFATIGKPGSGSNYGLECLAIGSILTGIVADKMLIRRAPSAN
jgi:hypothetical protein